MCSIENYTYLNVGEKKKKKRIRNTNQSIEVDCESGHIHYLKKKMERIYALTSLFRRKEMKMKKKK